MTLNWKFISVFYKCLLTSDWPDCIYVSYQPAIGERYKTEGYVDEIKLLLPFKVGGADKAKHIIHNDLHLSRNWSLKLSLLNTEKTKLVVLSSLPMNRRLQGSMLSCSESNLW